MKLNHLLILLALITSCQSSTKKYSYQPPVTNEAYQAQIKADKKKQAEMDLPFRGISSDKILQTIAFTSGLKQDQQKQAWPLIQRNKPELMIMPWSPDCNLTSIPEYRDLREKVPVMAACYSEGSVKTENLQTDYLKNWPYAQTMISDSQNGVYHSRIFGQKKSLVQVIVIDSTVAQLNDKQSSWLESELKKTSSLKIVVAASSEQKKITQLISQAGSKNVIILANDQSLETVEKLNVKNASSVYIAKSSLPHTDIASDINFGLIKINWASRKALIEVRSLLDSKVKSAEFTF